MKPHVKNVNPVPCLLKKKKIIPLGLATDIDDKTGVLQMGAFSQYLMNVCIDGDNHCGPKNSSFLQESVLLGVGVGLLVYLSIYL